MKTRFVILVVFIAVCLMLAISAQTNKKVKSKQTVTPQKELTSVMGKPVFESKEDSIITTVWIISQKKNKEVLKTSVGGNMYKMKDKFLLTDKTSKDKMLTGTHYLIFDVKNSLNGKQVADTSAKVEVVYPSKKTVSVHLLPMMNHFGSGVSLIEKGEYLFTINLNVGTSYRTTQFKYKVR
ncbi:MAG: hypothetical protein Q8L04_15840 [Ignavibacteria bacterium]|nr:hypothetical protein [Ignavibacteria bacterium]